MPSGEHELRRQAPLAARAPELGIVNLASEVSEMQDKIKCDADLLERGAALGVEVDDTTAHALSRREPRLLQHRAPAAVVGAVLLRFGGHVDEGDAAAGDL